jgi:hypothetical protein
MIAILRQLLAAILSISIAAPFATASYTYDPVGNRTQKISTLPGYPGGLSPPSTPLLEPRSPCGLRVAFVYWPPGQFSGPAGG